MRGKNCRAFADLVSYFAAQNILKYQRQTTLIMSSWFSSAAPRDPSELIHPVQTRYAPAALFGALVPEDLQWLCAGGFVTETQTFYITTATGGLVMCQVIHSSVG